MEASKKHCVVSAGIGGWYAEGVKRLEKSLIYHGFTGEMVTFKNVLPPGSPTHQENPYALKIYAIEEAIRQGFTHILWLDASVWAVQYPMPIFDVINEQGYYFWLSGYNCAQVCSDKCLDIFGISRNEAEKMPDVSTSMVGINLENPEGAEFFKQWRRSMLAGAFKGSRQHDGQSQDSRFLFHRQDQSAASLIVNQMGLEIHNPGHLSAYYAPKLPDSVVFTMRGM